MSNFNNKKTNKAKGPKPITKTMEFVVTGQDQKGVEYDVDSCKQIISDLQAAGVFDKLSIAVNISRDRIVDGAKGTIALARLLKYDQETGNMDVLLFGKNTEFADTIEGMVIVPRVRVGYNTTEVSSILGFDIVPAMEA